MTRIDERRQSLNFDDTWEVLVWDTAPEFKASLELAFSGLTATPPRSVKAGDVTGVRRETGGVNALLFAEFKDYDHPSIPAAHRLRAARQGTSDQVMSDLIAKLIDTLAGRTFAHDVHGHRDAQVTSWRAVLGDQHAKLLVLLCVEFPVTQSVAAKVWQTELKRRLAWLGPRANVVVTSGLRPFNGAGITYSVR